MSKISRLFAFLSKYKYYIVITIGVILVGFVGDNSVYRSLVLQYEIMDLNSEIDKYSKVYEADKQQLRDLERDPRNIERIARERYFMKAENEDIFVLSTDPRNTGDMPNGNENEETE